MKDKNDIEIKVGDLIKLVGFVQYADGLKEKVSKKTWIVEDLNNLPEKTEDMSYLVIGNTTDGIKPEFIHSLDLVKISTGSVPQNYEVLKDIKEKDWKVGDIVKITGKVSKETLENGFLKEVSNDKAHKHVLIVVDPIATGLLANVLK